MKYIYVLLLFSITNYIYLSGMEFPYYQYNLCMLSCADHNTDVHYSTQLDKTSTKTINKKSKSKHTTFWQRFLYMAASIVGHDKVSVKKPVTLSHDYARDIIYFD